jgi:hypothetical protein
LATLMVSMTVLTTGLFAHALVAADEPRPQVARAASR